ncbi:MAG: tyrosine-protein kinase family protein [Candidatus Xenobium sp.]|jgi:succinoglycan biosynthesis transport protein ExoP
MSTEGSETVAPSPPVADAGRAPGVEAIVGSEGIHGLLAILRDPESPVAESIRSIRTGLQRHLAAGVNCLMVLSPWGGDGKSTVCANLAASLSQLFIEVILVDADLRKPTLTRVFQREGQLGLTDCLDGRSPVSDIIQSTGIDRLSFVPAGTALANPADLLGRGHLAQTLQDLQSRCQCLILDTSPLTACGDALLIGAQIRHALMVISPKNWQGDAESRVRELLADHGVEVLGVILNGMDDHSEGYGYGYGHGYGQVPEGRKMKYSAQFAARHGHSGRSRDSAKSRGGLLQGFWKRLWRTHRERE